MIWIIWYFNICNFFCSGSQVFDHVGVLKNYLKFTGKHGCWNLLLIELQASYFQSATFIKKNTSKIPVLGVFADLSSSIFYTLCYKWNASINWRSVNSAATKCNMFQVISENTECETDKND